MADWSLIASVLTGGAAGALITAFATGERNRRDLALKVVDRFLDDWFDKWQEAKLIMRRRPPQSDLDWNKVRNLANWFETVASFYVNNQADREVLDTMDVPGQCRRFYDELRQARAIEPHGAVPAFDEATLSSLKALRRLYTERPRCDCGSC